MKLLEEYEFHPLCTEFPLPEENVAIEIAERMVKEGQFYPIIRSNNRILDGRVRLLLTLIGEIKPKFIDFNLSPVDEYSIVCRLNFDRRDLTTAERIEIGIKAQKWVRKQKGYKEESDPNLKKLQELAQDKEVAERVHSTSATVRQYRELKEKIEKDNDIKESIGRLKKPKNGSSIKRLYKEHIEKKKKPKGASFNVPKTLSKPELRQKVEDIREELKDIKLQKHHYETLFLEVKKIAKELGYWDNIVKRLEGVVEKQESPFPTIKQLREAELL
ncbi:MAG: hypothetical protein ACFFDF_08005 [Candidatus Odinarchaeota archaeon]